MITLHASGTQSATVTTEHSLGTATVEGKFKLELDLNAMVAGDVTELRIYKIILASGTKRLAWFHAYYGAPSLFDLVASSVEIWNELGDANSVEFTLKQTFGTSRSYPWKILRDSAGIPKNTAAAIPFRMLLSSDHLTGATGKTVTITRSLDGAAFEATTGSVAEIASGEYRFSATAADRNATDAIYRCTATSCDDTFIHVITS